MRWPWPCVWIATSAAIARRLCRAVPPKRRNRNAACPPAGKPAAGKQRLAAQGRSHALYYGGHLQGEWWREAAWKRRRRNCRPSSSTYWNLCAGCCGGGSRVESPNQELEAAAPEALPVGLGELTSQILEREVADWSRFQNRRQVAATRLCPGGHFQRPALSGAINKHGNRRLRPVLVEGACGSWFSNRNTVGQEMAGSPAGQKSGSGRRKKIIIAIARIFAVDWWRIRTGAARPKLGTQTSTRAWRVRSV